MSDSVRAKFTDSATRQQCELVIPPGGYIFVAKGSDKPKIGIAHPGCPELADLTLELDAFHCPACGFNGRVSGAWAAGRIQAVTVV